MAHIENKNSAIAVILIVLGVMILMRNWWFGFHFMFPWRLMWFPFTHLFVFWPFILIVIGLVLVLSRRSSGGQQ